ncbi:MAG: heme-binding protein [Ferruginibacter sp.]
MIQTNTISLSEAKNIATTAEKIAIENQCTVAIAIINESGFLVYFNKMDGTTLAAVDIAIAKARHAALYNRDTDFHENLLKGGNQLVLSLPAAMPIEGGVRILHEGKTVGAIGISGADSKVDGIIARAAVATFEAIN